MMKKMSWLFGAAIVASVGFGYVHAADKTTQATKADAAKAESGAATTIQGEVVDMTCYLGGGAKGAKHKDCAQACVKGGLPMGLLTNDGKLYLIVEDHAKKATYASLKDMAGDQASVTGKVSSQGGVQAIEASEAKKAS
ncbi:MAG: hypothetical protein JO102_05920 [Elusimicrobia bacterium]|nr:hypothetical protein [Elusimicrobiota bacterium]